MEMKISYSQNFEKQEVFGNRNGGRMGLMKKPILQKCDMPHFCKTGSVQEIDLREVFMAPRFLLFLQTRGDGLS